MGSRVESTFEKAVKLQQKKKVQQAQALYQKVLRQQPDHTGSLFNLGKLHFEQGDFKTAEQLIDQVLQREPDFAAGHYQRARLMRSQQRWMEAIQAFERVLQLEPALADAWLDCGNVKRNVGDNQGALACYQHALQIEPDNWKIHYSLVRMLVVPDPERRQNNEGLIRYHLAAALRLCPDPWQVYVGMGQTLLDQGLYAQARESLTKALDISPERLQAAIPLVMCLLKLGEHALSKQWWQRISDSNDPVLMTDLADVIWQFNYWRDGVGLLEKANQLRPGASTLFNLANAHERGWQLDQALIYCHELRQLKVEENRLLALEASLYNRQGNIEAALQCYRELYRRQGPESDFISSIAFCSLYSDQLTAKAVADLHRELVKSWETNTVPVRFSNRRDPSKKLKIGYVTADLHYQHPVDIFMRPVFAAHDKQQFETTIYYSGHSYDANTLLAKQSVQHWIAVAGWSNERLKARILDDAIDVLVDLSGHSANHRLRMFATRAAPVQISMLGYPHSTGLTQMDYLVGDQVLCPPQYRHLCSEKILAVSNAVFAFPREDVWGPVDIKKARERTAVVFGSFNNIPKLTEATIALWAALLREVSDAKMLLKAPSFQDEGTVKRYQDLFAKYGVASERIEFRGPTGLALMMQEYNDVDIALDPVPYNGGTTTYQGLWMGVPTVTLAGENFCQRMGASILTHSGLSELVAKDANEYVAIAARLANERHTLLRLKNDLRGLMSTAPSTDSVKFTRDLESGFRLAWQRWCQSV